MGIGCEEEELEPAGGEEGPEDVAVGDPDRLVPHRPDGRPGQLRGRLQEEAPRQVEVEGAGRAELREITLVDPLHPPGEPQQALGALVGIPGVPECP